MKQNIATVLNERNDESVEDIDTKLVELENELIRLATSKAGYDGVANEIHRLRDLKEKTMVRNAERQSQRQRIDEMTEFLQEQTGFILDYDEQLVRRLIEKVIIFDEKVTVESKSGVEIEVNR